MSESDGLIAAYILDGKGGGRDLSWDDVDAWTADQGKIWVHLDRSGQRTRVWLTEKSGLSQLQIDALLAGETRPRVAFVGDGFLMTLRGVNLNPGANPDDMVSLRIWGDGSRLITVRLRRLVAVNDVRERIAAGTGPVDVGDLLRSLALALVQRMSPVIEDMNDEIDSLEDEVVEEATAGLRSRLKELRRQAIALRRYLAPQRDALTRLHTDEVPWISHDQRLAFRECADQVARIVEDLDAMRERAGVIQDELSNKIAEHMNRNMYTLSVVAALMLPLGVITGILGMNVGGIPMSENPYGFAAIIVLLSVIVALQVVIFRRMKWI